MKKLFILLCFVLILSGCAIFQNSSTESNSSSSSMPNSESSLSSSSKYDVSQFDVLGKFYCSNDYYNIEWFENNPESIPSIEFFKDGRCILFVNYFEGTCDISGVYSIEGNKIKVELDFQGTIFEGTGTEYMDDQYVFTIISDNEITIDKGYYTVEAGDPFIRYPGNE